MNNETQTMTEQRLIRVEEELRTARAQIETLSQWQRRQQGAARLRRACYASGILAVTVAVGFGRLSLEAKSQPKGKPKGSPKGMTVKAPFFVVGEDNKPLMVVQSGAGTPKGRGMALFNPQGEVAAQLTVSDEGHGALIVRNGVAGSGARAGVLIDAEGNPEFRLKGADNKLFMHMGAKGLQIMNASEAVVVNLGMSETGGLMNLCDPAGNTMVEAGTLPTKRAIVRVYPMSGRVSGPSIPDFIMGSKPK